MKNIGIKILSLSIMLVFIFQVNCIAVTDTGSLENEKDENNKEIVQSQEKLEEVKKEKSQVAVEVEDLNNKIESYEEEINNLDTQIGDLEEHISDAETRIEQYENDYKEKEKLLSERLVLMYEDGEISYMDFLLSSKGLTDFLSKYFLVSELASIDTELLDQIADEKLKIETEKSNLEKNKLQLASSKAEKESVNANLQKAKDEKSIQVAQLSQEEQDIQKKIDELREDNKKIDAELAAFEAAQRKAEEERKAAEAAKAKAEKERRAAEEKKKKEEATTANETNNVDEDNSSTSEENTSSNEDEDEDYDNSNQNTSSQGFIRPVSGYSITTGWYYSSGSVHGAVDFSGSGIYGKTVIAAKDGVVAKTDNLTSSYGTYVMIRHDNGWYTLYAHGIPGSIAVNVGERVSQGQKIMQVGSSGNSTGPHLHCEIRTSYSFSSRVNPINYLP